MDGRARLAPGVLRVASSGRHPDVELEQYGGGGLQSYADADGGERVGRQLPGDAEPCDAVSGRIWFQPCRDAECDEYVYGLERGRQEADPGGGVTLGGSCRQDRSRGRFELRARECQFAAVVRAGRAEYSGHPGVGRAGSVHRQAGDEYDGGAGCSGRLPRLAQEQKQPALGAG